MAIDIYADMLQLEGSGWEGDLEKMRASRVEE